MTGVVPVAARSLPSHLPALPNARAVWGQRPGSNAGGHSPPLFPRSRSCLLADRFTSQTPAIMANRRGILDAPQVITRQSSSPKCQLPLVIRQMLQVLACCWPATVCQCGRSLRKTSHAVHSPNYRAQETEGQWRGYLSGGVDCRCTGGAGMSIRIAPFGGWGWGVWGWPTMDTSMG